MSRNGRRPRRDTIVVIKLHAIPTNYYSVTVLSMRALFYAMLEPQRTCRYSNARRDTGSRARRRENEDVVKCVGISCERVHLCRCAQESSRQRSGSRRATCRRVDDDGDDDGRGGGVSVTPEPDSHAV